MCLSTKRLVVMVTPRHLMTHSFSKAVCNYAQTGLLEFNQKPHSIHILANFRRWMLAASWSQALFYYVLLYAIGDGFELDSENGKLCIQLQCACLPVLLAVDDERAENEVCFRFLMILFMVFVLSYERCNNNSHTYRHKTKRIYLQFSSFDFGHFA